MNEQMIRNCELFIRNRDCLKHVFRWDSNLLLLGCSSLATNQDAMLDERRLNECKNILKNTVGSFNNFRGITRTVVVTALALSDEPEVTLRKALNVYGMLKKEFATTSYLPFVAILIAQNVEEEQYQSIVERTKRIYKGMKADHRFLTSHEDCAFCALMACSDLSDEALLREAENCYQILSKEFNSKNAVQSLSHVLALYAGTAQQKCDRVIRLYNKMREAGIKYGTYNELPTLGLLAMLDVDTEELIKQIVEVSDWLNQQKGFGFWGGVSNKARFMYAGILLQKEYMISQQMSTVAVNSAVSVIIAQQIAICTAIAASSAAAASNSSN